MAKDVEVVAYYKETIVGTKEVDVYDFISQDFVKETVDVLKKTRFEVGNAPELPYQVMCKIENNGFFVCIKGKDWRYTRPANNGQTVVSNDLGYIAIGVKTFSAEKEAL